MVRGFHPVPCAVTAPRAWQPPGLPRGKLVFAARWAVTVLAFWVVFHSIDVAAVADLIGRAAPLALGVAGLVVIAQFAVLVWRWQLVIHVLGGKAVGFGPLALLLGHSFLIGQVLPSSVGGDVARTVLHSRSTGAAAAARSVICDRLLGFAALALLAIPALPVIAEMIGGVTPFLTMTILVLGIMTAVALVLAYSLTYGFPWLGLHLATVAGDLRITLRSGKTGLLAMALGIGSSLSGVLLIYCIGSAIGADLRVAGLPRSGAAGAAGFGTADFAGRVGCARGSFGCRLQPCPRRSGGSGGDLRNVRTDDAAGGRRRSSDCAAPRVGRYREKGARWRVTRERSALRSMSSGLIPRCCKMFAIYSTRMGCERLSSVPILTSMSDSMSAAFTPIIGATEPH